MTDNGFSIRALTGQMLVQLRALAERCGLSGYSSMTKAELIDALSRQEEPGAAPSVSADTGTSISPAPVPAQAIQAEAVQARPSHSQPAQDQATQVVFLPRDPQWAYCFWSISQADQARASAAGAVGLCLRLADVTGLGSQQSHPHALQELVVDAQATEWFLPVPLDGRDYRVELGYRLNGGGWLSLAFSAVAQVPRLSPSTVIADAFVPFSLEEPPAPPQFEPVVSGGVQHEQLYQRATGGEPRRWRVGSEAFHELAPGSGVDQAELTDSGAGLWASGRSESGAGVPRQRSFWLVADAELIVYGATDPSASLFIGDEQIPLSADGTFRVHVPFRDGQQLYPIRALAADGVQERSIRLEFDRRTPEAKVNRREEALAEWF